MRLKSILWIKMVLMINNASQITIMFPNIDDNRQTASSILDCYLYSFNKHHSFLMSVIKTIIL